MTFTNAEKLQGIGIFASLLDLSQPEHRNALKIARQMQRDLRNTSTVQQTLDSWVL
jgi:hypothetical protein